jgi:hypothetical protein
MSNTDLIVVTRGKIPGGAKGDIVNTFRDCYRKFGFKSPYKVELLITENELIRKDSIREEKSRMGVTTIEDDDEVCSHNTWRGYPTITVSVERLQGFSKPARKGALSHEAAHTVLHGSLEYNIFRVPDDCKQISAVKGIENAALEQVIRNLSSAIKDCEVSKFLVLHDFIDCHAAFILEWIRPTDPATLKASRIGRQGRFLYLTSILKPMLLCHPLLAIPKSKKISLERQVLMGRRMEELIEHLEQYEQNKLLQVASTIADNLTDDTHSNVDSALRQAITLA